MISKTLNGNDDYADYTAMEPKHSLCCDIWHENFAMASLLYIHKIIMLTCQGQYQSHLL